MYVSEVLSLETYTYSWNMFFQIVALVFAIA